MATISQKVKLDLDECRMMVLGTQVLISLQFNVVFQSNFDSAPAASQHLVAVGLALLLIAFAVFEWGPAYHRIALDGKPTIGAHMFMTRTMVVAPLPVAGALAMDVYIVGEVLCGRRIGIGLGVGMLCCSLAAWYILGLLGRAGRPKEVIDEMRRSPEEEENETLHDRVSQVMTETRVVLPGAQ